MAVTGRPRRHCRGEVHAEVIHVSGPRDPCRQVDVDGFEYRAVGTDRDEGRQPGDLGSDVYGGGRQGAHDDTPVASKRSRATIAAAGGRHENTPWGWPSTSGVAAPTMPRTNRYATPPRWSSGTYAAPRRQRR